jgi:oligopeptide/dipeptide ABC transporter ATP-binding protein
MAPHLEVQDLTVGFDTFDGYVPVLNVHDLAIQKGEAFGLVGESGAGKTVLALAILGLLQQPPAHVTAQALKVAGEDVLAKSPREVRALRGRKMSMIFQDPMSALNPMFSVGSILMDVVKERAGLERDAVSTRVLELLRLVELPDPETMLKKYPHQLSGGQRQRVIIALALACGSQFLVADEPTRNLDVTVQASVLNTIRKLREELQVSVLFIANTLALAAASCDRVGVLLQGVIVEVGTVREVLHTPMHPYTKDLLRAVPHRGERRADARLAVEKSTGDLSHCPHYARCTVRLSRCADGEPLELMQVSDSHSVACWAAVGENVGASAEDIR